MTKPPVLTALLFSSDEIVVINKLTSDGKAHHRNPYFLPKRSKLPFTQRNILASITKNKPARHNQNSGNDILMD